MPEDQLRTIVDGIRTRLQAELDAQLTAVAESHDRALAELKTTAEAEAERRWTTTLEKERADWNARLQSEVSSARSEVERTMVAESIRARVEAEQAAAEAASQARRELDQAVTAERKRGQEEIDRLSATLEELRGHGESELAQMRAALNAERASNADALAEARKTAAAAVAPAKDTAAILDAIRTIDDSTSLSTALAAVTRAAASHAPRAAMFVVHGSELREWPVSGVAGVDAGPIRADGREAGFLADVLRSGDVVTIGADGGAAPDFARLSPGRSAVAVPFTLGGQPVAVLYADEGTNGQTPGAWRETVQILGRHASAFLAYITAAKTAQAMHLLGGVHGAPAATESTGDDETQGARRYAKLLVSEIKLYNEGAVRVGRERRDLTRRLQAEIERARKLYEDQIPASVRGRDAYFQQELVQTLADGDQSLLG